jgi:hypothetical protein
MYFGGLPRYIALPSTGIKVCFVLMDHLNQLRDRLSALKQEHRDLDDILTRLEEAYPRDELQMRRLKKRKLQLKDDIVKIEGMLMPDIIA